MPTQDRREDNGMVENESVGNHSAMSSIIIEVIRTVLNFLFFLTIRFHKYKKAFFYQYRLKINLVL